jgi:hypothetical protein
MIRPCIGRKADAASRLLCLVSIKVSVYILYDGTYRKLLLKFLEPRLPCLDNGAHSVQISDSYVDYMMTLYRLRHQNGRPPNGIWYMYYTGRWKGIQYVYIMCPMGGESL